jgi:S-DNA-T family DNA segregation ATPase FtsK/SpoIIIE
MGDMSATLNGLFSEFGVNAEVTSHVVGPTTTRYETELGPGVVPSTVFKLSEAFAVKLGVKTVRITALANRPGLGIDIPNQERVPIPFQRFQLNGAHPLTIPLGIDGDNQPIAINLGKLPHLLVAGTTNSGKSTWINTAISTLIKRTAPEVLRLVLIDPKEVEFASYAGTPHLWCPVVTDTRKAQHALKALVDEMTHRYSVIREAGYRNVESFNAAVDSGRINATALPYLVAVVDELADLIMMDKAIEPLLVRLAQKGRAAAIHLLLATQRPEVKVVTGLLKSNIPARIAFQVANHHDSGVILDQTGAQTLLGRGDGLFVAPDAPQASRFQGVMISDAEIDQIVDAARQWYPHDYAGMPEPDREGPEQPQPAGDNEVPTSRPGQRQQHQKDTKHDKTEREGFWHRRVSAKVAAALVLAAIVFGFALAGGGNSSETPLPNPANAYTTVATPPTP